MAKPSKLPRWADQDIVDPTSSVNNVVEPSEAKKDLGHGPLGEFPPRQYQNWFMRLVYLWIKWFDEQNTNVIVLSGTFGCKITTSYVTVEQTFTIRWRKTNDIVSIYFPQVSGTSNSNDLSVHPDEASSFPTEILPNVLAPAGQISAPLSVIVDNSGIQLGSIAISNTPTTKWNLSIGTPLNSGGFTPSGTKGFNPGTVTYSVDNG